MKNKIEPISDLKSHNLKREDEIRANTKFLNSMVAAVFLNKNNNKKSLNVKSDKSSAVKNKKDDKPIKDEVSKEKKVEKEEKSKK